MRPCSIVFVGNNAAYFCLQRLELARGLVVAEHRVTAILPHASDAAAVREITAAGVAVQFMPYEPAGMNPWRELRTLWSLYRQLCGIRPEIVHLLTIKPILLGGIAARWAGISARVHSVLGLGYLFHSSDFRARAARLLLRPGFRFALGGEGCRILVENEADGRLLRDRGFAPPGAAGRFRQICGSGVKLDHHDPAAQPDDPPIVLFAARLIRSKGVEDFVETARRLKPTWPRVRFVICGGIAATSPGALSAAQVERWVAEGSVEWWGQRTDFPSVLARASLLVLPSRYGEGLPQVLLMAAASARPIVTTDIPGCNDAVRDGVNGLLVPTRDPAALAAAIGRLLNDPALRQRMGAAGRALVAEFSYEKVIAGSLRVYEELLASGKSPAMATSTES